MGKWEIKREVFDDVTPTGKKKSVLSDQSLSSLKELLKRRFLEKHPNLVEEFRSVHGEKYDYSLIDYVDSSTPLEIICREHGQFKQTYWNHIIGRGCPSCGREKSSKSRLLSTEQIISRFQKVHGNRYNYDRVNYINAKTKVEIVCPDHGSFFQFPYSHESGSRCPKCADRTRRSGRLLALDNLIAQFRSVHGEKYDYTKCVYKGSTKPIVIICSHHGEFTQKPCVHKLGSGCPECAKANGRSPKFSAEKVIQQFISRFGDRYDYSEVVYRGHKEKVLIGCPKHGKFSQTPSKHKSGRGCPKCSLECLNSKRLHSTDRVIRKFREVHGDKYDYSKVSYARNDQKVTIVCPRHGEFLQTPHNHKNGHTCPECAHQDRSSRRRDALETVISKFRSVHGDLYNYGSVVYKNTRTKISIECPEHGMFQQTPSSHIQGTGCPVCLRKNRKNKP